MSRKWILLVSASAMAAAALVAACGDDDVIVKPPRDGGTSDTSTSTDSSAPDAGGDTGTDGGVETLTFTKLASFAAAQGQLPEGVVVQGGVPIVGFAPQGKLVKVLPDGGTTDFASFTTPSNTFTVGLALDPSNNVFIAVAATGASPAPAPGIYKVLAAGSVAPVPYNTTGAAMAGFNNGLDFIGADLYASDSSGKIFKIDALGAATEWKADPVLQGDVAACNSQNGFPIGVNGIAHDDNFIYGVNLDKGIFFRIKREANGSAGALETLYQNCDFFGADGVVRDADGTFIVANNPKNRIDRVTVSGTTATFKTIGTGAPLDGPASVFIEGTAPNKKLWVTNSAFGSSAVDGGNPQPSLVSAPIK